MLNRWFLAHPKRVDESYLQHRRAAWSFSASLLKAAAACFIHGLLPALFEATASQTVEALHERMVKQRRGVRPDGSPVSASQHRTPLRDIGRR
jgi:Family of unknown function (DUF6356)